jgi:hypothetical protein
MPTIEDLTEASWKKRKPRPHDSEPADPILRPGEIEELTGASWKTISRARPDAVVQLGIRAVGMRRSKALGPPTRIR